VSEVVSVDVAIVGGGLGGLSAARHLQTDGHTVAVLEGHSKPGGYAHFFRKEDFRFEVALHALDGLGPRGWARPMFATLGILDTVEFRALDPFYTVRFPDFEVSVSTDLGRYLDAFAAVFPDQVDGARELFAAIERVGHDVGRYGADRSSGVRVAQAEMPARYPDMSVAFASSWEQFVGRFLDSAEARAFVGTLWGYLGLPPSRLSAGQFALVLGSYHTGGAWYPIGGSGTMSWKIVEQIEAAGGEVHLRTVVESLERHGEHWLIRTDQNVEVRARAVVSNASPGATVRLLSGEDVDEDWLADLRRDQPSLSSLVVHLGVDRDLAAEGWGHHEFFDMVGYDFEAEYQAILEGRFHDVGMIISNYTVTDPTNSPPGGTVLVLTTLAPWDHRDVWGTGGRLDGYRSNPDYQVIKQEAGDILIDRAERLIPGLRDSIVHCTIGTPLTNRRYVRQDGGALYGREQTVLNQMHRRRPTTPVDGLFLCGAWVGGGGMTAAMGSGRSAAGAASRFLAGLEA
jgi:prolycopene isomerase